MYISYALHRLTERMIHRLRPASATVGLLRIEVVEMAVDPEVQDCALALVHVMWVWMGSM